MNDGLNFIQSNLNWILPVALLDLLLKPIALWKAARNTQLGWFIALVILNTAGILPIIYIGFFQGKTKKN